VSIKVKEKKRKREKKRERRRKKGWQYGDIDSAKKNIYERIS